MSFDKTPEEVSITLSEILNEFDKENKEVLAQKLVERLGLNNCGGERLKVQIEGLLKRELSQSEEFKVDALYRILEFYGRSGEVY